LERLENREMLTGTGFESISTNVGTMLQGLPPGLQNIVATADPPTTSGSPSASALTPAQLAQETAIAQSINAFGVDLYESLQSQAGGSGNTVFSPLSISAALAMAYAGANGQTAAQMADVLHFTGDSGAVEQAFGTLLSDLNTADQGTPNVLSVADALWGQQGMQILTPFLQTMQADFSGDLKQIDFASNPSGAVSTINSWVAQQTDNLINNLLSPGDVTTLTRLVLVNAVYFKASWATPFDPNQTENDTFNLVSGSQVQTPTMHNLSGYGYMVSDGFQVLDIPYAGGRFSMDVILPDQGSSASALNVNQLPANLTTWFGGLQYQQVDVSLPKFDIDTHFELGPQLQNLGMTDAFGSSADFSGITNPAALYISNVFHEATISVDENGTVAAAATAVGMTALDARAPTNMSFVIFDANHPFLFVIRDDQSGAVLFMGQEMDPTLTSGDPSAPPIGTGPVLLPPTLTPTPPPTGFQPIVEPVTPPKSGFAPITGTASVVVMGPVPNTRLTTLNRGQPSIPTIPVGPIIIGPGGVVSLTNESPSAPRGNHHS
jgi:serine protease inhibitor